jgi:thiol-disulfide isomerase/thioredoxin
MSSKLTFFVVLCILGATIIQCALYDDKDAIINIESYDDYIQRIFEHPRGKFKLVLYGEENCPRCKKFQDIVYSIAAEFDGVLQLYYVDCWSVKFRQEERDRIVQCRRELRESLPQISFFEHKQRGRDPLTGGRYAPHEEHYNGIGKLEAIQEFVEKIMPTEREILNKTVEYKQFLESKPHLHKILLLTDYHTTPLAFRALTREFRGHFAVKHLKSTLILL